MQFYDILYKEFKGIYPESSHCHESEKQSYYKTL